MPSLVPVRKVFLPRVALAVKAFAGSITRISVLSVIAANSSIVVRTVRLKVTATLSVTNAKGAENMTRMMKRATSRVAKTKTKHALVWFSQT